VVVAVTGGTGYVGSRIADAAERGGATLLRLGRADFSLEAGIDPATLDGVDALVHAAWDFRVRTASEIDRVNVQGSTRLLDAAAAAGIERLVFISTLSAFPGSRSHYGRAKLAVENHVRSLGGAAIRPGLVWGEPGGSLYATLARLARGARVLPVFTGERQRLHLCHEEDLGRLVASVLVDGRVAGRTIAAAAAESVSLATILRRIAAAHGRRLRVVRVPWPAAWAALRTLELAGLEPPFRSDSVVSLVGLDRDPFGPDGPPPGFRPFSPRSLGDSQPGGR
jgi:nucleoside-diphosphate-sugar epimerase